MINKIQTKIYFLSLSIFIVLIDQFTKYLIFYNKKLFINKEKNDIKKNKFSNQISKKYPSYINVLKIINNYFNN